jgi:hypothetical protein
MKTRSGEDRRKDQPERWLEDPEVKKHRAFDWTKMILPHAPLLLKIIPLLMIGGVTATQAPKVFDMLNGDDTIDVVDGDVHAPTTENMDAQQNRALNEIIEKLKKQDARIAQNVRDGIPLDQEQNARLDSLEALVQ